MVGVGSTTIRGLRSAAISSNRGFTTRKNAAATAPPPSNRNARMPAMIHGSFDFFFAATGGKDAEGACCWTTGGVATGGATGPVAALDNAPLEDDVGVGGAADVGGGTGGGGGGAGGGGAETGSVAPG